MKRGLRLRLAVTHALVALLAVLAVAVIVFVAEGRRFDTYLSQVQHSRNDAVARILTQTYKAPNGWDASAIYSLSQIARFSGVDVAVYSPQGQLLFTVQGRTAGGGAVGGAAGATPAPQATSLSREQFEVRSYSIVVAGRKIASAEVYAPRSARAAAEAAFETALTRDLVVAAAVAALLAFLVSMVVSRRVTGPLEELADAAEDVVAGNFDVRVSPRGDDEVGALAAAFNAMADRLARDEEWRREMTADLSLELSAPLATIQSRVEALESGALPVTPENLRVVGTEAERLGRLLGALRSLSDLEGEDLSLEHETLDLADVGREAVARAEPAYAVKGVTLGAGLSPVPVKGDREQLLQVAAGLLDNALKFTPSGGRVEVTVAVGDGPAGGAEGGGLWAELSVADNGPGIDPADLPFVFDRFYRSQAPRGSQGVGLGLAIARGFVEAQGGVVEAAERPGGGAVFAVWLPLAG